MLTTEELNKQLTQLYLSRANDFRKVLKELSVQDKEKSYPGPLLISPTPKYVNQNTKVLIIGQQTNGWSYWRKDIDDVENVKILLKLYKNFNLGENVGSTPFWNVIRKLEEALGIEPLSVLWTNINKFSAEYKKNTSEIISLSDNEIDIISKVGDLLINEIEILQPDICIFFTGPNLDEKLKSIFEGILFEEVSNWDTRELAKLKHQKLPELSFRTYHPSFLRRIKNLEEKFINFMKKTK